MVYKHALRAKEALEAQLRPKEEGPLTMQMCEDKLHRARVKLKKAHTAAQREEEAVEKAKACSEVSRGVPRQK